MDDIIYMKQAFALARKGAGHVSPNPMVGAVVVKNGTVIATGYHNGSGGDHAEIAAFKNSRQPLDGATLYVNLEPCCHEDKKTPPCTREIIRRGIKRVVIGSIDPNPKVAGNGIAELESASIEVLSGLLKAESDRLNESFFCYITTGLPFTVIKVASSLDGRIALGNGLSKWITGAKAREYVHRLRHETDGIVVGANTVLKDNPELTTRQVEGGISPVRVLLDPGLRIPKSARVFNSSARTVLVTGPLVRTDRQRVASLGCEHIEVELEAGQDDGSPAADKVDIRCMKQELGQFGLTSLLIEGGSAVITSAVQAGAVDKIILMLAPKLLGGDAVPVIGELGLRELSGAVMIKDKKVVTCGDDIIVEGYL